MDQVAERSDDRASQSGVEALSPAESLRLVEFARACKAATRVVTLYPGGHPAIASTLDRIVQLTSPAQLPAPLRIRVLADTLLLDGRALSRSDAAIGELAAILHEHLIGELTIYAGGDIEAWRSFLLLLGRSADAVRTEGGIARMWTTMAGRHVDIQEIDYGHVLRERGAGNAAGWDRIIASCLQGDALVIPDDVVRELLEAANASDVLRNLMQAVDTRAAEAGGGVGVRSVAIARLLQGIVDAVKERHHEALPSLMRQIATAVGQLSPEMVVQLMNVVAAEDPAGGDAVSAEGSPGSGVLEALTKHMPDDVVAGFVARNAMAEDSSIDRVAQAFQSLVPDDTQRERILSLAHADARNAPSGGAEGFEEAWDKVVQKMMTSYSDKPFVSETYARELTRARKQAVQIEQVHDDPPERMAAWLASVATPELRALDLALVLDLLRIEELTDRWATIMRPAVELLDDLLLVGDIDAAEQLLEAIVGWTRPTAPPDRRQAALIAIDVLVAGQMMQNVVMHLATLDDGNFERVKKMCVSVGEVLIRPLTEALSAETRTRPRERLTAILLAFGPVARREAERLKNSPNPAVRRTAIQLMREFGGHAVLPQLSALLSDRESQVQLEAVRAILTIGTDEAFRILEQALTTGEAASREAIMQSLATSRDEGAAPLFVYLLDRIDHRGPLSSVYLRSIEALGTLKDPAGVEALKAALYRGEWWSPRRTAVLRGAAAAALARIGTPAAVEILEEAAVAGPRGVRAAVRSQAPVLRRAGGGRA